MADQWARALDLTASMPKFEPPFPAPLKSKAGSLLRLLRGRRSWMDVLFVRGYKMKMGHVRTPGLDIFMVNEPSLVRKILVDDAARFPKHRLLHKMFSALFGNSIFTSNGSQWEQQRRMINPAFEHARLKTVFPMMVTAVAEMLERFSVMADGKSHDVDIETTHLAADVIFRTIFSMPLQRQEAQAIFDAFNRYQDAAPHVALFVSPKPLIWLFETLFMGRARVAATQIRQQIEAVIRPRYEAFQRGEAGDERDLLAALMEARDRETGVAFTFEELVDQTAVFFWPAMKRLPVPCRGRCICSQSARTSRSRCMRKHSPSWATGSRCTRTCATWSARAMCSGKPCGSIHQQVSSCAKRLKPSACATKPSRLARW